MRLDFAGFPVWTTESLDDLLAVFPVVIGHEEVRQKSLVKNRISNNM